MKTPCTDPQIEVRLPGGFSGNMIRASKRFFLIEDEILFGHCGDENGREHLRNV